MLRVRVIDCVLFCLFDRCVQRRQRASLEYYLWYATHVFCGQGLRSPDALPIMFALIQRNPELVEHIRLVDRDEFLVSFVRFG